MKRFIQFYVLVFLVSTLYFLLYSSVSLTWMTLYLFGAMWIPGLISIGYLKLEKKPIKEGLVWSIRFNRYFFMGLIAPIGLMVLVVLFSFVINPSSFGFPDEYRVLFDQAAIPRSMHWLVMIAQILLNGVIFGGTINAVFGLGEELAWRGFLFSASTSMPIWQSGLIIGALWGFWHAPLVLQGYNFPNNPLLGVFLMTMACAPLGLIMSILVKRGQSVVIAALFHGVFNAVAGVTILFFNQTTEWLFGPFSLIAIFVYAVVALWMSIWDRKLDLRGVESLEDR